MPKSFQELFYRLGENIFQYLPNFLAGILLVAIGWILGWFVKRVVIQMLIILRLDRILRRFRWGEEFAKADVRYGFYNLFGDLAFIIVSLIFLNNALSVWQLTILSDLLQNGVLFFPKLIIAIVMFGVGWLIAHWAAVSVQGTLLKEGVPRATLIARFIKAVLLLFFSSMALLELDIAREVIIIGFTISFATLGVLTVVLAATGGKEFVARILESLNEG